MSKLKLPFSKYFLSILLIGLLFLLAACDTTSQEGLDLNEVQDSMNEPQACFSCQLFMFIFNAIANLSSALYPRLCSIALSLLGLGLFAWLLWHVFTLLTTLREPNLSQFYVSLFQTLFKSGFVAILIHYRERLYEVINTVLEPIAMIFIDLSKTILNNNWITPLKTARGLNLSFNGAPGFPADMGKELVELIYRITVTLNIGRILGLKLMLGTDFVNFWIGLVTTLIFLLMTLFFPFYLLDGLFRLAFVFALLPFFLVAWVFKKTEHYMTKAWAIFFGAFAQILVACIFVAISVAVLETFIELNGYGNFLGTAGDIDKFGEIEGDQLLYPFLSFFFVAIYIYAMSKRITSVTAHFTGAPSSNIIGNVLDRFKKAVKALALIAVAVAAASVGLSAAAHVAFDRAKNEAKSAASQQGGGGS
ncbi:MAG: hypothetical protein J6Y03_04760 [Alphaproteobacteria bacterium]|nr:hypothetical protein [Alphaproteobacteria bacterium]